MPKTDSRDLDNEIAGPLTWPQRLFCVCCFLFPVVGFFASKGVVPLLVLVVITGIGAVWNRRRYLNRLPASLLAIVAAVFVWATVSTFWAPDTGKAFVGALKLGANLILGISVIAVVLASSRSLKKAIVGYVFAGWVIAAVLMWVEVFFKGPIFGSFFGADYQLFDDVGVGYFWLSPISAVLLLLLSPMLIFAEDKFGKYLPLIVLAALLWSVISIKFLAGVVAISLGALAMLMVHYAGRTAVNIVTGLFVAFVVLAPFFGQHVDTSIKMTERLGIPEHQTIHRLSIWKFTSERIAEYPFRGWGMNASQAVPGADEVLVGRGGRRIGEALPLHPHNASLQVWLELGVVGVLAVVGLLVFLGLSIGRLCAQPALRVVASITFGNVVAAFILANLSFGLWQAWWLATLWFGAAVSLAATSSMSRILLTVGGESE